MSRDRGQDWRGLRMLSPPDAEALARERAVLVDLAARPLASRMRGYLQSAMTLGGGTVLAALFAGAVFGYQLLLVAPVAMALGLCMMAAISWQTLSTGRRPWPAMREDAERFFAWALGALLSSLILRFPQYALASTVLVDIGDLAGLPGVSPVWVGGVVLVWSVTVSGL